MLQILSCQSRVLTVEFIPDRLEYLQIAAQTDPNTVDFFFRRLRKLRRAIYKKAGIRNEGFCFGLKLQSVFLELLQT